MNTKNPLVDMMRVVAAYASGCTDAYEIVTLCEGVTAHARAVRRAERQLARLVESTRGINE